LTFILLCYFVIRYCYFVINVICVFSFIRNFPWIFFTIIRDYTQFMKSYISYFREIKNCRRIYGSMPIKRPEYHRSSQLRCVRFNIDWNLKKHFISAAKFSDNHSCSHNFLSLTRQTIQINVLLCSETLKIF